MARDRNRFSPEPDEEALESLEGPKVVRRPRGASQVASPVSTLHAEESEPRAFRRLPLVLLIAGVGLLAAIPFRSASPPSTSRSTKGLTPPRIAPSPVSLVQDEEGPALPRSIPFAGQERDASLVAERPKPLPAPTDAAPPEIPDQYEPLVAPTHAAPSFLDSAEQQASAVLPEHLQQLARRGRWPIETRETPPEMPAAVAIPQLPSQANAVDTPAPAPNHDSVATPVVGRAPLTTASPSAVPTSPVPRSSSPAQGTRWRVYKIRDGDTLESIATKFLNDPGRSHDIYRANQELLPSPNALPIGTNIVVPPAL